MQPQDSEKEEMLERWAFWKYHGLGNDFVIVDERERGDEAFGYWTAERVQGVCDRNRGIGADGVLLALPPTSGMEEADSRLVIFNADGSVPEMCGNGLRCFALYLAERGIVAKEEMKIETGRGLLTCFLSKDSEGRRSQVRVDMGAPILERSKIPMRGGEDGPCLEESLDVSGFRFSFSAVSMGNPHMVIFQAAGAEEREIAPLLERHPLFPKRVNVEFVDVLAPDRLEVVVYERGCGFTQACGTGACAVAVAAVLTGRSPYDQEIQTRLPGGPLWITVPQDLSTVWMRGSATAVFSGVWAG